MVNAWTGLIYFKICERSLLTISVHVATFANPWFFQMWKQKCQCGNFETMLVFDRPWPFAGTITTKLQLPLEEFKKILEVGSRLDIEGFQKAKGHCWSAALFKSEMSKLSFVTFKRLLMILPCQSVLMLLRHGWGKSLMLHYEDGIHKNKSLNIERLFFHMINLMLKPSYKMPNPSHCSRSFQEYLNLIAIKIKLPSALTSNQLVLHVTHF